MLKKISIAAAAMIVSAAALLSFAGYRFSNDLVWPKVLSYEDSFRGEFGRRWISEEWYRSLPKEEFYIDSPNGYKLHAMFVPAEVQSDKTIIFVHGYQVTLAGGFKYLPIFRKRGYNAFLFDSRYHGKSGGSNVTFGYFEKRDLQACVDWVTHRVGLNSFIGVHGDSMGAAISVMHSAIDPRTEFYILDGCMTDLSLQYEHMLKRRYRFPVRPVVDAASIICKMRGGIFFGDISPANEIRKSKASFLFIHGGDDLLITPSNSERVYRECRGMKRLWICPGAGHSQAIIVAPVEYDRRVGDFLSEVEAKRSL